MIKFYYKIKQSKKKFDISPFNQKLFWHISTCAQSNVIEKI